MVDYTFEWVICLYLWVAIFYFGAWFVENTKWSHHSFVLQKRSQWGWRLQPPCIMRWNFFLICLWQFPFHLLSLQNLIPVPQRKTPCLQQLDFSSPLRHFFTFQQQCIDVLLIYNISRASLCIVKIILTKNKLYIGEVLK